MACVVMTVAGPMDPATMTHVGAVSAREWLLNDQAALWHGTKEETTRLTLETLFAYRRSPLGCLENLSISREDTQQELCGPFKRAGSGLLVVCTPRSYWLGGAENAQARAQHMRALAEDSGTSVILGTCPAPGKPASALQTEYDREVANLVTDLAVGFGGDSQSKAAPTLDREQQRIRPGLIGEVPLWADSDEAELQLRTCVEAQRQTGAPLMVSGPISERMMRVLAGEAGAPGPHGPCLWGKTAFFDVSVASASDLLARGAFIGLCPPHCGADLAAGPYVGQRPLRTEAAFLAAITEIPTGRLLIGSGLRFQTDLTAYGGPGLRYAPDLMSSLGLCVSKEGVLRALLEFLMYPWKPPAPPEKIEQYIECHWCGSKKKVGEHFSKNSLDYCSPKCISAHRQVDFDPNKNGK